MMADKPLTAAELREALCLLAAELVALDVPPVTFMGADRFVDPADTKRRDEAMAAYCATIGALQALVPDVAGMTDPWSQRWALQTLRKRAAARVVAGRHRQATGEVREGGVRA